jgi:transposase
MRKVVRASVPPWEEQMDAYIGIDIGKATYVVVVLQDAKVQRAEFDNTPQGHTHLQRWLKRASVRRGQVCMEATGRYWESVAECLHTAGFTLHVVNPAQVKAFRNSKLQRNKNDQVDAYLLALFCRQCEPHPWQPPAAAVKELQALVHHLDSLIEERTRVKNRQQALNPSDFVRSQLQAQLEFLEQQITTLKQHIRDHIDADPDLKRDARLLETIPGIAAATAARVLAEIGDASLFQSADQLAAYAGVHPANFTSGTSVHAHPRMSKAGNARLRAALFMSALSAKRHNPRVTPLAARLEAKGRAHMEIIGAAMHKLIRIIFGVLHSQQPFRPLTA